MSDLSEDNRPVTNVLRFWKAWLRRPAQLGAVAPSSKSLATAMAGEIDPDEDGAVVELGGGTGSITAALLKTGMHPADLVVIEREPALCDVINRRFPGVTVICGDARNLALLLRRAGIDRVKAVVSGLPLVLMSPEARRGILAQAFAAMPHDHGIFVQFTYSPVSPLSRGTATAFGLVGDRSEWVLDNLPPAAVWRYRRRPVVTSRPAWLPRSSDARSAPPLA